MAHCDEAVNAVPSETEAV